MDDPRHRATPPGWPWSRDAGKASCRPTRPRAWRVHRRALGALSFHETKNINLRRGRARCWSTTRARGSAETIREKGTNRSSSSAARSTSTPWVGGPVPPPSDPLALPRGAALEQADSITSPAPRAVGPSPRGPPAHEAGGRLRRLVVPDHCTHNAHMYYLLLRDLDDREMVHRPLEGEAGSERCSITSRCIPRWRAFATGAAGALPVTDSVSDRLRDAVVDRAGRPPGPRWETADAALREDRAGGSIAGVAVPLPHRFRRTRSGAGCAGS